MLREEAVERHDQRLPRRARVPGVEAQVLTRLDQDRVGCHTRSVGQVGEVAPEEAERADGGSVRHHDLESAGWQEFGSGPTLAGNAVLRCGPDRGTQVSGERGQGGEVQVAVPGLTGYRQLERPADRAPRDGCGTEPLAAQPPQRDRERRLREMRVAESRAAQGAATFVDPPGEEGIQRSAHADLRRVGAGTGTASS